jgi:cytochrome c55X
MLSLLAVASAAAEEPLSGPRQAELRNLLLQDCGSCHGLTLKGGLGPALLPEALVDKPVAFLTHTILEGRPGTAMPPWRGLLTEQEAAWIAELLKMGDVP